MLTRWEGDRDRDLVGGSIWECLDGLLLTMVRAHPSINGSRVLLRSNPVDWASCALGACASGLDMVGDGVHTEACDEFSFLGGVCPMPL